ncbi:Ribonuclease H-like domain protein [Raphanus sativus]|nr:Ribonuclease H-like domain protein [Raphanus sativus]
MMINPDADLIDRGGSIVVREVWAYNLVSEFHLISAVVEDFPFISMDTEFPGVIFKAEPAILRRGNPGYLYKLLKSNVDVLSLIQVGITLTDADGNLPDLGGEPTGAASSGNSISATSTWIATPTRRTRSSSSVGTGSISSVTAARGSSRRGSRS